MRRKLLAAMFLGCGAATAGCTFNDGAFETGGSGGTTTTTTTTPTGGGGGTTTTVDPNCGNNKLDAGEECDVGAANSDTGECTLACKNAICGDDHVKDGGVEECDNGKANSNSGACTLECKEAKCGDGLKHAGVEECDNGAMNADNAVCTSQCTAAVCSDGVVYEGVETCDDGNTAPGDGCEADCKTKCGDGIVYAGVEMCEDGNVFDGDGCSKSCVLEAFCGNGRVEPGEVCDDDVGCADCTQIDPLTICGKAPVIGPKMEIAPKHLFVTDFLGDTTAMGVMADKIMPAPMMCGPTKKPALLSYTTGDHGSIVTMETVMDAGTFGDTVLWAYRDCLKERQLYACNDDNGGTMLSKIKLGYLPPKTTVYVVVGGQTDMFMGKFKLHVEEQVVTLLFGTTFEAGLDPMTALDQNGAAGGKTWEHCDTLGGCDPNTTGSWSDFGYVYVKDNPNDTYAGVTLTSPTFKVGAFNQVFAQASFDFVQKANGATETFSIQATDDMGVFGDAYSISTTFSNRQTADVSASAIGNMSYAVRLKYDDAGGDGEYVQVDDLFVYAY